MIQHQHQLMLEGVDENQIQNKTLAINSKSMCYHFEPLCPRQNACKLANEAEGEKVTSNIHKTGIDVYEV